jgi:hypothetical protein
MSSNSPRDMHSAEKVRRMARRAFDKVERMKRKQEAFHRKEALKKPRSSLDLLVWD